MNKPSITIHSACQGLALLGLIAVLSFTSTPGYSAEKIESKTIFIKKHHTTTHEGLVDKANKSHEEMAAKDWEFKDLEVYDEDGDLRGFFVTYSRTVE